MIKSLPLVFSLLSLTVSAPALSMEVDELRQRLVANTLPTGELQRWNGLPGTHGSVYRAQGAVYFLLQNGSEDSELTFPRLYNTVHEAFVLRSAKRQPAKLTQGPKEWTIHVPAEVERPLLAVLLVDAMPYWSPDPRLVKPQEDGTIVLAARDAEVHGEKLQFEPLPHKNTLGYWVNPQDWAEWHFERARPGTYAVEILQGCGEGQGGSQVELRVQQQRLAFEVEDTGHFQTFRRRRVGEVELQDSGILTLEVRIRRLAQRAAMDLREVRLVPVNVAAPPRP